MHVTCFDAGFVWCYVQLCKLIEDVSVSQTSAIDVQFIVVVTCVAPPMDIIIIIVINNHHIIIHHHHNSHTELTSLAEAVYDVNSVVLLYCSFDLC